MLVTLLTLFLLPSSSRHMRFDQKQRQIVCFRFQFNLGPCDEALSSKICLRCGELKTFNDFLLLMHSHILIIF